MGFQAAMAPFSGAGPGNEARSALLSPGVRFQHQPGQRTHIALPPTAILLTPILSTWLRILFSHLFYFSSSLSLSF